MSKLKDLYIEVGEGNKSSIIEELESISNAFDDSKIYDELFGE